MSQLATLSTHIAKLLPSFGEHDFYAGLAKMLRSFANIDEVCVITYPDLAGPDISYRENPIEGPNLDTFISGSFLLDPFYVAGARQHKYGFFTLEQLAPNGFKGSEYYRSYYRFSGLFNECGYLVPTGGHGFVNISLGRTSGKKSFERAALGLLSDLTPLILSVVQYHSIAIPNEEKETLRTSLRSQLESALSSFGMSRLTPRESEIINWILHGHTTKAIASALDITIETVKLHRKNAYRKLEIANQSELFWSFIQALQNCGSEYQGGDPLQQATTSHL